MTQKRRGQCDCGGRVGHSYRARDAGSQKLNRARDSVSPRTSRENQPCQCLDFSPVRYILNFGPPDV